jgi:uncharacterized membrane-anchored protein
MLTCDSHVVTTGELLHDRPLTRVSRVAVKVPQMTAYFWITKVLTTGMGEAASDFLGRRLGAAVAMPLAGAALVAALAAQSSVRRYVAGVYWLAVVMVSVFGTMVADGVHNGAGIPYVVSTVFFGGVLAAILFAWYRIEDTLSTHSIYTRRREMFYWATVVVTFALGTAAGDMTASTLHLGYVASCVVFAVVITVPAVAYWRFGLNAIFAFWFAYVVTRPLGASAADWMAVPRHQGGLGWGTGLVTLSMTAAILGFVGYLALTRRDVEV